MLHTDCGGPIRCHTTVTEKTSCLHADFVSWTDFKQYKTSIARLIEFNSGLDFMVSLMTTGSDLHGR